MQLQTFAAGLSRGGTGDEDLSDVWIYGVGGRACVSGDADAVVRAELLPHALGHLTGDLLADGALLRKQLV